MRYNTSLTNYKDGATRAHLARYFVAKSYIELGDDVIDAACGTGYGSLVISPICNKVYAYDQIDSIKGNDSIIYTKANFEEPIAFPEADVAISLETIEHLTKDGSRKFITNLLEHTKRFFIYSVPLEEELGENPFHQQVFNSFTIRDLVKTDGWQEFHSYMQGNHFICVMWRTQ